MAQRVGYITDEISLTGRGRFLLFEFDSFQGKIRAGDLIELRQVEAIVWRDKVIAVEFATLRNGIAHPSLLLKNMKDFPANLETRNLELWKVEIGHET